MKTTLRIALLSGLLFTAPAWADTGVPLELSYQATVTDDAGNLIADADPENFEVTVRIWTEATGGDLLWSEKQSVSIFKGRFAMILGQGAEVPTAGGTEPRPDLDTILDDSERFTEITLKSLDVAGDPKTFTPRQKLVATATALRAKVAETLVDGSVTEAAIPARSLSGQILQDGAIGSREIAPQGIAATNIVNNSITALQLGENSVGRSEIAPEAVGPAEIRRGGVFEEQLADDAVTGDKIRNRSISGSDVGLRTLTGANIEDASLTGDKLARTSITADKLASGVGVVRMLRSADRISQWSPKENPPQSSTIAIQPGGDIPSSGINGLILKVLLQRSTSAPVGLVFPGADGRTPSGRIPVYQANSVVNYQGSWEQATVFCPVRLTNGAWTFVVDAVDPQQVNPWKPSQPLRVYLSVIGYY